MAPSGMVTLSPTAMMRPSAMTIVPPSIVRSGETTIRALVKALTVGVFDRIPSSGVVWANRREAASSVIAIVRIIMGYKITRVAQPRKRVGMGWGRLLDCERLSIDQFVVLGFGFVIAGGATKWRDNDREVAHGRANQGD